MVALGEGRRGERLVSRRTRTHARKHARRCNYQLEPCYRGETVETGERICLGRVHGERTLGEIVKVNRATVTVHQLRDARRYSRAPGWYDLARSFVRFARRAPSDGTSSRYCVWCPSRRRPKRAEPEIVHEIVNVYGGLSPEIECDGELSRSQVERRRAVLNRRMRDLFTRARPARLGRRGI